LENFSTRLLSKAVHIPYKGGASACSILLQNVQLVFSTVSTAVGSIQGKKIRALAMTGNQRFELMQSCRPWNKPGSKVRGQ
jgi:tripartite-type tricarboxylate transporter receptor subunit TctC